MSACLSIPFFRSRLQLRQQTPRAEKFAKMGLQTLAFVILILHSFPKELHGRPGGEWMQHTYNISLPRSARRNALPAGKPTLLVLSVNVV